MSHRPLYMKSRYRYLKGLLFLVFVAVVAYGLYGFSWRRSPQDLVTNSVLKDKTFEAKVQEIVSPRLKIKAYLIEDKTNPIISVSFLFKNAGYATDNEGEQGIANLVASLLTEGAGHLTAQQMKEEMESRAIAISFAADKDDFSGSLLTTRDNMFKAFSLLRDMLGQPRFDPEDIMRAKTVLVEALLRQSEHPQSRLSLKMNEVLFAGHPYGRNPLGKVKDIERISAAQLNQFVTDHLNRQNLIVGIAGDISKNEAERMLDNVFADIGSNGRINFVRNPEVKFDGRQILMPEQTGQNISLKAVAGVGRNDADFYPLFIANQVLGGSGLTSRLSKEIREKRGLTYGVYSYLDLTDKAPLLMAGYATTAENYEEAEKLFVKEWEAFSKKGISAEELEKAKNYLIASYNLRFSSISGIADILAAMQKYNLGADFLKQRNKYVKEVTLEQVNKAAKKYFDVNRLVSVSIGRFNEGTRE